MPHLALSAIGPDRPGLVAALTGVLLDHGLNVEDSQGTILRGHFSIVLIVAASDTVDRDRLRGDLARAGEKLGLEAIVLQDIDQIDPAAPEPSHLITLYGLDHPGILHSAAQTLARDGVDITDLNTRLVEDEGEQPLYALMMEVALPAGGSPRELEATVTALGESEGLEVAVEDL
jgi:glycine cleavage system transcriptional repressor